MSKSPTALKLLRERADPKLSVRAMAAALDMTPSRYTHYEDSRTFKRPFFPMDLVRQLVPILTARGIPEADVLALGGVDRGAGEIVPLPQAPRLQLVTMQVALPSEAALARMFEGLLRPLDRDLSVAELAQTLARRLPTGLAQLRDLMPVLESDAEHEDDEALPARARDHLSSPPKPST